MSYGELIRGGLGWGRRTLLSISSVDDLSTVDISAEGTLDWWWAGNRAAASLPYQLPVNDVHQKRGGLGMLFRGFQWVLGGGGAALTQTSSRTLQAAGDDNAIGITLNHTDRTGWFTSGGSITSFLGRGFQLSLPAATRARRLKMYMVTFQCGITTTARIEGVSGEATNFFSQASGSYPVVTLDFAAGKARTLIVQSVVTEQTATNPNFQVQAFTLSERP